NAVGRVFLKAVVEPNGHVSDITVMRGLRPDCDQEAVRVMRLFNAWKPAQKEGKLVRQEISYPVVFRATAPVNYVDGKRIDYFDKDNQLTGDRQTAHFQQTYPVDSATGLPSGELIVSEIRSSGKAVETFRLPLTRIENNPTQPDKAITYTIGHKLPDTKWYNEAYTIDGSGKLLGRRNGNEVILYNSNGLVSSTKNVGGSTTQMEWHSNGQLHQLLKTEKSAVALATINLYRLVSAWDSTGRALVVDGTGQMSYCSQVKSRASDSKLTQFTEVGTYLDGFKHGVWQGRYSDDSYSYEESFDRGKSMGGVATINKTTKVPYGPTDQNPEFKGGQSGMYTFLGQNIIYPADAAKAGIQGKVFVSFVVCTDGTLCDYELLKGAHSSLDKEALRVVRKMSGLWKPGLQRGEPVRVKYNLPISFQFN
ncbi:MAG TPA: energy transducer TonB, partial [Fibrella sp.]